MKKKTITHTLWTSMALALTLLMSSCLGSNDHTDSSPQCAIVAFSVGNITSNVTVKKYDSKGNATDTIVARTILGSDIYFNIDQLNGYIHVVDSLPDWANITRVMPYFTSQGNVYAKQNAEDDIFYPLSSGRDSLDFSKTVELLCVSTNGLSSRTYTVDLYKHQVSTDTLKWTEKTSDLAIAGSSKVFYADEKVFVFSQNAEGEPVVTFANDDDATTWSVPVTIPVDGGSITYFNNKFYGLGDDGYIYTSTPAQLAATWEKASNQTVTRLLAADAYYLYAYDGGAIIATNDLSEWEPQGMTDLDMLPESNCHSAFYASNTNSSLCTAVMAGLSSNNDKNGVSWYKVSSQEESPNQDWTYIQVTADNPYGLPHLANFSMTYYKRALYAIGAESGNYKYLYRSDDNGITWHPQTKMYPVPSNLDAANGAASIAAVGKELWIIQENGKVWQGSIQ